MKYSWALDVVVLGNRIQEAHEGVLECTIGRKGPKS